MLAPLCSDPSNGLPGDRGHEALALETIEDPHPFYRRLRETMPLSRVGDSGVHLVANWALIEEALGREADFSANLTGVLVRSESGEPDVFELPSLGGASVIATADEPEHSVHRALVQPRLVNQRIAVLEEQMRSWVVEGLTPWIAEGGGDFIPIAERIPALALADLLGLPAQDVSRFRQWAMTGGDMLAGDASVDRLIGLAEETARMSAYLGEHLDRRLAAQDEAIQPGPDAALLDLLAFGVRAGRISRDEAVGITIVMFGAGGESTAALLGSAMRWLAEDADLADALRAAPEKIPRFIEEVVRLEPPFKFHYRSVTRTCSLGGFQLEKGDRLMLLWAAANRDPQVFEDADTLRLDRRHPKKHLGFGRGSHFCVGATLARLEAVVLFEELLRRTRSFGVPKGAVPSYAHSIFVRRLEGLPITLST